MKANDSRHGSYAGWCAHRKARQSPCTPCLMAARAYRRDVNAKRHARRNPCTACGHLALDGSDLCSDCADLAIPDTLRKVRDGLIWRWEKAS